MSDFSDSFQRAFVATSYLLDRRDEQLTDALPEDSPVARQIAAALANPDRRARAAVLAAEVAKVIQSVEAARIR